MPPHGCAVWVQEDIQNAAGQPEEDGSPTIFLPPVNGTTNQDQAVGQSIGERQWSHRISMVLVGNVACFEARTRHPIRVQTSRKPSTW